MPAQHGKYLVISHGDIASFVTLALQERPDRVVLWHPVLSRDAAGEQRRIYSLRQAGLMHVREIVEQDCTLPVFGLNQEPVAGEVVAESGSVSLQLTDLAILSAGLAAKARGCAGMVLPLQVGPDFDGLALWLERKVVLEQVLSLSSGIHSGRGSTSMVIEVPLVDLTDEQVLDLAGGLNVPIATDAWWCEQGGSESCGRCRSCLRWESLLGALR